MGWSESEKQLTTNLSPVSVILPTYNRAPTLRRAIDSVLTQTHTALELIVVDDGSTDATAELVRQIDDSRIRYERRASNRGVAAARNLGIELATSEWLAFQDSDDEWLPCKLTEQLAAAKNAPADVGLVLAGYHVAEQNGMVDIRPASLLRGGDVTVDVLDGWPIITPTWLVRRSLLQSLGGFDERLECLEDWDLMFRMLTRTAVVAIPGPVLVKYGSADSVAAPARRLAPALATILDRHGARWRRHPRRLAHRLRHLGSLEYDLGQRAAARRTAARAIAHDPLTFAGYMLFAAMWAGPRAVARVERRWSPQVSMLLATTERGAPGPVSASTRTR